MVKPPCFCIGHRDIQYDQLLQNQSASLQEDREFVAKVEAALEASQVDEEALLEERRRKRQEILARHGQGLVPGAGEALARSWD